MASLLATAAVACDDAGPDASADTTGSTGDETTAATPTVEVR